MAVVQSGRVQLAATVELVPTAGCSPGTWDVVATVETLTPPKVTVELGTVGTLELTGGESAT